MTPIGNIFFLDIETIPKYKTFDLVPEPLQELFIKKFKKQIEEAEPIALLAPDFDLQYKSKVRAVWLEKAGFYAEFNTIVCVCMGCVVNVTETNPMGKLFVRAYTGTEAEILAAVATSLKKGTPNLLCAHNGLSFDFPILTRKYLMSGLTIPDKFNNFGKKPWETPFIDTMQMWGCTEFKYTASLDMLCYLFGIPSPKDKLDGSMVATAFYAGDLDSIKRYCIGDVVSMVNLYQAFTDGKRYTDDLLEFKL